MVPSCLDQVMPMLWHPNLHASNLFLLVKELTGVLKPPFTISSIIDWQGQGAWIGPAFLQLTVLHIVQHNEGVPSGLWLPTSLNNLNHLSLTEQAKAVKAE